MKISKILNWKIILFIVVLFVLVFFSSIIRFFVNIQWFQEVNYTSVFIKRIFAQVILGAPIFLVLFILIYGYLVYLKKEYIKFSNIIYEKKQMKSINLKLSLVSVFMSFLFSSYISSNYWFDILKFLNSNSFNLTEPLFNKDISFYIFKLPMYRVLYGLILFTLILIAIITIIFYIFVAADNIGFYKENVIRMNRGRKIDHVKNIIEYGGRRFAIIISVIFITIGLGYILKNYNLVYSLKGVAFGASYTDVNITLFFNRILIGVSILAAIFIYFAISKKKVKLTIWIIGIMFSLTIFKGLSEVVVQKFIVSPNEIDKEKQYIEYNIKYTKIGFGLNNVEEKDFPVEQNLTAKDIDNNENTISNIRINDFIPALDVYNQLQGIRPYYRFNDIDIDRYNINGKYTQVFVSPRELDTQKLANVTQTWINKHLVYTHGYGVTMSPVNTVTQQGLPQMIIKDIPPVSLVNIKIDVPQIYFGELTNDYIITNTKSGQQEIDYPSGDTNKYTNYEGNAGIKLGGLNKLLFMIDEGSFNFILSQGITKDSKIIINRNIVDRVKKIAPFLSYDQDPYLVINDGKLYWIMDAYTVSSDFPYSEPYNGVNYIRNSIKVIIDAYNGTTDFYLIDKKDPLAVAYSKIFPDLFKNYEDIPKGFIEHFRYPSDIFNLQLDVYKKYHMSDPRVFYNKEDLWNTVSLSPSEDNTANYMQINNSTRLEPSYVVMKLPEGQNEEFMLISPYTPSGKENMISWLGARMDGENYGKLIVYKFPKQKVTYGPIQFMKRMHQDTKISQEITLWDQKGSNVIYGNIIIVPIEKSLLYVLPVYIKSSGQNSIPEMKRVVLGYGDTIVMEETLDKALNDIFDLEKDGTLQEGKVPIQDKQNNLDNNINELIKDANAAFENAKKAQQQGDWSGYGQYINQLENILKQLNGEE